MSNGRSVRFLSDSELLRQCRLDVFRGSGPGGQKRNKTSNSVRLTHLPTGLHVTADESRSQLENKTRSLRRLRLRLAIELREPISDRFEPPDWFCSIRHNNRIAASHRHPYYAPAAGLILDLLKAMDGSPADVGIMLGVPTTAVIRFLEEEPQLWTAANRIRAESNLPPLTHRR
jgi:hypothetical protein